MKILERLKKPVSGLAIFSLVLQMLLMGSPTMAATLYSINASGGAGGTAVALPASVPFGGSSTMTATPNTGYYFTEWSDVTWHSCPADNSTANPYGIAHVYSNVNCRANFATQTQLTVNAPTITKTKIYNGTTLANVTAGSISTNLHGDHVTVTATASYDTKNVGSGKTITVVYSISGSDAYKYIKPVDSHVHDGVITPKDLTISSPTITLSKPYDGNTSATVAAGTLSGVVPGDTVTVSANAHYDDRFVGTGKTLYYTYVLAGADADNYNEPAGSHVHTGVITKKQLSITDPTITLVKEYDGNTSASVTPGSLIGVVPGENIWVTAHAVASYDNKNVGTDKTITVVYSLSGWDSGHYTKPLDYVVGTGEIQKKQLTITDPSITKVKIYDGNAVAAVSAGTLSGVIAGETVGVTAAANYDSEDAGNGKTIVVSYTLTGPDADKYRAPADYTITDGTINKLQLEINLPDLTDTKVYDGNTSAVVVPGSLHTIIEGDDVTPTATANYDTKNVGSDKTITVAYGLEGADAGNYIAPGNDISEFGEITPKTLSISAPDIQLTKIYDGTTDAVVATGDLSGVVEGDDVTVSATANYDTKDAGTEKTITVVYLVTGDDSSNYTGLDDFTTDQGVITQKQLTITDPEITKTKVYDGSTATAVIPGEVSGVVGDEDVTVSADADFDTKNVGTGKTITVVYSLDGIDINNYLVPTNFIVTDGVITAKAITVTAADKTKVIGAADPTLTYAITTGSLVDGDVLAGTLSRVEGEGVGTYAITLGTLANTNYAITFVPANFTITAAPVASTTGTEGAAGAVAGVTTKNPSTTPATTSGSGNNEEVKGDTDTPNWWNTTVMGVARWIWGLLTLIAIVLLAYWWLILGKKRKKKDDKKKK